jgi:hypothetical protein
MAGFLREKAGGQGRVVPPAGSIPQQTTVGEITSK